MTSRHPDREHSPLTALQFVRLLADGECDRSTADGHNICRDHNEDTPFGKRGAGNACTPCMAKAVIDGDIVIAWNPETDPNRKDQETKGTE